MVAFDTISQFPVGLIPCRVTDVICGGLFHRLSPCKSHDGKETHWKKEEILCQSQPSFKVVKFLGVKVKVGGSLSQDG